MRSGPYKPNESWEKRAVVAVSKFNPIALGIKRWTQHTDKVFKQGVNSRTGKLNPAKDERPLDKS